MPGWVKEHGSQGGGRTDGAQGVPGSAQLPLIPDTQEEAPERSQAPALPKKGMTDQQRDALLAEVLGDVAHVATLVEQLTKQLEGVQESMAANDLIRWRNALDHKMQELANVNLSEHAAGRMQAVASAWIEQLSQETNTLVKLQVKKAVNDVMAFNQLMDRLQQAWLLRLASIAGVCFVSTLAGHLVWALF